MSHDTRYLALLIAPYSFSPLPPPPPKSPLFPYTTLFRSMSDEPLDLDRHRGMSEQKAVDLRRALAEAESHADRKSTRLNSSHGYISYAVFCLKKKKK